MEDDDTTFRTFIYKNRLDLEGRLFDPDPEFCAMLGYNYQELQGRSIKDVTHHEDLEDSIGLFRDLAEGDRDAIQLEKRVITRSGETRKIKIHDVLIRDSGGTPVEVVAYIHDITQQQQLQDRLNQQLQQREKLLNALNEGYLQIDEDLNIIDVNPAYCRMTGYAREELMQKGLQAVHPEMNREQLKVVFDRAHRKGWDQFETQHTDSEGNILYVEISLAPLEEEGHRYVAGFVRDITERIRAQKRLERSEQRFKSLFDQNPNAVYSFDLEGNFLSANQALEQQLGYSFEELKSTGFMKLVAEEDRSAVWRKFQKATSGQSQTYEAKGRHKDGSTVHFIVTNLPIFVNGEIEGVFGIAQDITELKKTTRKLIESEERWHRLVEYNPQSVIILIDRRIHYINQSGAELLGAVYPEEVIGRELFEFVPEDDRELVSERMQKYDNRIEMPPSEQKLMRLDGEMRYVIAHSIPIQYKGEDAVQTVLFDITEQRKRERLIKGSLKEKEILLQEIHHRVKNNLAVITGLLELQSMTVEDEKVKDVLRQSQMRVYSMAMIHEKLYSTESLSEVGFDQYIIDLVDTIKESYTVQNDVDVNFELDPTELTVTKAIPAALILNELVVNCYKHAFSEGDNGTITIGLNARGEEIELSVTDDGSGLPEDFTIQDQQSLGMTLIQTLVKQLDASLEYADRSEEDPGRSGSLFRITFQKEKQH